MPDVPPDPDQPQSHDRPESSAESEASSQHRGRGYRSARQAGPSRPFAPRSPLRRRWSNAGMRIGTSNTVHAVRFDERGRHRGDGRREERVGPACHTGHDRADDSDALAPVYNQPVTCHNCRTYRVAFEQGEPYDTNSNHWMLPLPGLPAMPSWPPDEHEHPGTDHDG